MWDARTNCKCAITIRGTLNGHRINLSTAKYLRPDRANDLDAAQALANHWQRVGKAEPLPEFAAATAVAGAAEPKSEADRPLIKTAVESYIKSQVDTGLSDSTLAGKINVYQKGDGSLLAFAHRSGLRFISDLTIPRIIEWRSTWKLGPFARRQRQSGVVAFFHYLRTCKMVNPQHPVDLKDAFGKVICRREQETQIFDRDEYKRLVDATWIYNDDAGLRTGERLRSIIEVMRWTGLRISDASILPREKLLVDHTTGAGAISIRMRKTKTWIHCDVPPHVVDLLLKTPRGRGHNDKYFFWTGTSKPSSAVANWQDKFDRLARLAGFAATKEEAASTGLKWAHPHMLRDTFAVESILSGALTIKQVSDLLGHASVVTTERHYMPLVLSLQTLLTQSVRSSWAAQGIDVSKSAPMLGKKGHSLTLVKKVG